MLRNELERQKKALGQEVALLHKEKSTLHDRGECRNVTASTADTCNQLIRRVLAQLMIMVMKIKVLGFVWFVFWSGSNMLVFI